MKSSKIEWTESTWNPSTGCSKISAGCANCYAEVMTRRLQAMSIEKYKDGFKLKCHYDELQLPYTWKKSRMVFVNSMSDIFHEDMPFEFIKAVFKVMNECPQHIFQILTKRADILEKYYTLLKWTPNIWMGVTVENEKVVRRIDSLRMVPAQVKFLSIEPLISAIPNLNLLNIDWVIVGGESGPKSRPIKEEWVLDIKNQCEQKQIPFFFKQWGGKNKKASGKLLQGKIYCQMPKNNNKELITIV
jgi:protein gp37